MYVELFKKGKNEGEEFYVENRLPIRRIFSYDKIRLSNKSPLLNLRDAETWRLMLNQKIISHDYGTVKNGWHDKITGYLLSELIQSDIDVPEDVLYLIVSDGREHGCYKNLDVYLSLCNNESSLRYLLKNGAKFKHIKGCGKSTMEKYILYGRFINVIRDYQSQVDLKYIRKNKITVMDSAFSLLKKGEEDSAAFLAYLVCKV